MSAARHSRIGLPLSHDSASAMASRFSSIRSAIRSRTSERSAAEVAFHPGAAAHAASRAASMSSDVPRPTSQKTWPVIGVTFSKYSPLTGATHSPPMKWS